MANIITTANVKALMQSATFATFRISLFAAGLPDSNSFSAFGNTFTKGLTINTLVTTAPILIDGTGDINVINTGAVNLAGFSALNISGTGTFTLASSGAVTVVGPVSFDIDAATPFTLGGVAVPTISSTNTLTNKRHTLRAPAVTQSATPTINTDVTDVAHITALAQAITSMTTNLSGTPVQGDTLRIDITDNGTARAITWGASFESGAAILPATTVISTRLDIMLYWNTVTSKWRCMAAG